MGRDGSGNVLAPNLTLKLNALLQNFPLSQRKDEQTQVTFLILRNISNLRQVYHFYCTLGHNRVQSTKSEMTRLQFWRFVKDSHIHHYGLSLPEMDRIIAACLEKGSVHQPTERLSLSDFLSAITILSFAMFRDKIRNNTNRPTNSKTKKDKSKSSGPSSGSFRSQSYILPQCLQMLMSEHIMKYSGRVKGGFLFDPRRTINALAYMEGSWKIYRSLCEQQTREPTLRMRKLLLALKDFQIIGPRLSADAFLKILASDNPSVVQGGVYNLEIEMTFLEYFEALLASAVLFVDEEMMKQPASFQAPKVRRKFNSGPSSAKSSLGHSRPGSAYARHTSARSSKTVSSQPATITSIDEDDMNSELATIKSDAESVKENDMEEKMDTTMSKLEELGIEDPTGRPSIRRTSSSSSIDLSSMFDDMDEDGEEMAMASPKSKGSSPEVITKEMEEKEKQFNVWSLKLRIFFTRHLFPAWQRLELLRIEAARHRGRRLAS
uniref:radial spoke head 10 homolog B-like n=1 Tax=Styela clava TaxID=7725 RepID=UPI00193A6E15|nr:radial spoke head 10 homolog B-like [Styela clava]